MADYQMKNGQGSAFPKNKTKDKDHISESKCIKDEKPVRSMRLLE